MVVGLFGAGFPFVNGSSSAVGTDEVFGRDLLCEYAVLVWTLTNKASIHLSRVTVKNVP